MNVTSTLEMGFPLAEQLIANAGTKKGIQGSSAIRRDRFEHFNLRGHRFGGLLGVWAPSSYPLYAGNRKNREAKLIKLGRRDETMKPSRRTVLDRLK